MPFITGQFDTVSGLLESLYDKHIENVTSISGVAVHPSLDGYYSNVFISSGNGSYDISTGVAARLYLDTFNNSSTRGSSYRGRRFRGTPDLPSGVYLGDNLLHLSADGYNGTGIVSAVGAMAFVGAENWTTGSNGTYFKLRLTPSGQITPIDRLWIESDGKVGLSNISPKYTLDVSGSGNFTDGIYWNGTPVNTGIDISFLVPNQNFNSYTGKFIKMTTDLTSGIQNQTISFPQTMPSIPVVVCDFENDVDNYIYNHAIYGVTTSGFKVGFSDILSNSGCRLYTTASLV